MSGYDPRISAPGVKDARRIEGAVVIELLLYYLSKLVAPGIRCDAESEKYPES